MVFECHIVRSLKSRQVEAKVLLPAVPNIGDTLWIAKGNVPQRVFVAKVGYDSTDFTFRAEDDRPMAIVLLEIEDPPRDH